MAKKPTPVLDAAVHISLTPNPDGNADLALQHALGLTIVDKASHESVLQAVKVWKVENREIEADYRTRLVKPLYGAYKAALDMMERHLTPRAKAIEIGDRISGQWTAAEQRRVREEEERQRVENERIARETRQRELDAQEAAALKIEANSPDLSAREEKFVAEFVRTNYGLDAARAAGYKDAAKMAERLLAMPKILAAITAKRQADMIRQQAEATKAAPLHVEAPQVESQVGSVAGMAQKSYYSCGAVDVLALAKAVIAGKAPLAAIQPNTVFLNEQARSLKQLFPQSYPGCELKVTKGLAG